MMRPPARAKKGKQTRRPGSRRPEVHLNLNVRGMLSSATVGINERCDELRRGGKKVFKLGLGQSPFPVPRPVIEALRASAHRKEYLPVKGLRELREAVADYHRRSEGIGCSGDDVLVGPGSKELMFLLQLTYYGDLVVPSPSWVSYAPQARIVGRQISWLHTRREDHWQVTPDQLRNLCSRDPARPRIVTLNYPANPTGTTYSAAELEELARVARQHRVVLLSDEIYGELHHHDQHVSIARFYPEGTILSAGLSKWCGAGGWRLGTFMFPPSMGWLRDTMAAVASETYTSTSAPIQYAAVRAFQGGTRLARYLWHARRILGLLGRWCAGRLTEGGALLERPQGAFYLFPDFSPLAQRLRARGITGNRQMCERLLAETGVAILPGSDFGRPPEELTARIAYVDFDGARALAASEGIARDQPLDEDFLTRYCGGVLEAVERIVDWVGAVRRRR